MKPKIVFEDEEILVVDKPAGWIVNEADTTTSQPVLQTWLGDLDYPLSQSKTERSGIVHRLDKETSGLLIVAKTKEAFAALQKQFKERKVEKTYTTLLRGRLPSQEGEIEVPLGRLPWRRDRFGVLPGGRESKTSYKVEEYYQKDGQDYCLVKAFPKTGRTHQIRVHFKYMGHPIVGDPFYAGRKTARRERAWCPRLFLHASGLKFTHPTTNKSLVFESKLPASLSSVLKSLSKL
jgi:23S rRNA pseudouridine1911/1915/1917 synthase